MTQPLPVISTVATAPFHVMVKPIGPICNLNCSYCFYLEKEELYPGRSSWRMSDEVLEAFVRQYIDGQPGGGDIHFAWQGGEPMLMGIDFFRRVVELQDRYAGGRVVQNSFQTNGTLINDAWCELFAERKFLIGLSVDGPAGLHDHYRVDKAGRPSFERVAGGMALLKKHGVDFNTLCVVNRTNSVRPLEVYEFLKTHGSGFIQFIPIVERAGNGAGALAEPPLLGSVPADAPVAVTPWSVEPQAYGQFLCAIFDHWVRRDIGQVFVQIFDVQLAIEMNLPAPICVFSETCGRAVAMEHNGDLYSCDHYVYPRYKLGNILQTPAAALVDSQFQREFGRAKRDSLPRYCRECEVLRNCWGECPKHRFTTTPDGEAGLNYLCPAYKKFFNHIRPYMRLMADLLRAGRPAADAMEILARPRQQAPGAPAAPRVERNAPCPCGSGKKYKKCCGVLSGR